MLITDISTDFKGGEGFRAVATTLLEAYGLIQSRPPGDR